MQAKQNRQKDLAAGLEQLPTELLKLLEQAETYTSNLIKTQQRLLEEDQNKPRKGGRQSVRKSR